MELIFMLLYEQLSAENKALKNEIEKLKKLNKWYEEQFKLSRKKMFGASSERSDMDQLNMFNEAEAESQAIAVEPTIEEITYKRKKKKGSREKSLENLPVETIEYTIEDNNCPNCNSQLHIMSKEIRKELKIVPAKVSVIEHISNIYTCRNCEKTDITTPIITAPSPKALIPRSIVSPSVMAFIMNQKFVNSLPLYRQEQEFKRMNVLLSRQNLSNWMIAGAKILKPLVEEMKNNLLSKKVLHADETTLEVLCEPDRPAQTSSYMWIYRTTGCDKPIVIYDYQQGRAGIYAENFLKGFTGYLHTDGWGGYHRLEPNITLCGCWAHTRRKFNEALTTKEADSLASIGLNYCNKLFDIERDITDNTPDEIFVLRQEKSKPVAEEFFAWATDSLQKALPKSLIGTALQYALNQKKYLLSFLKDGRLELSNNRAERSVKPFVIGRKNWLFCNTPNGANSSAIIYSIIETAKENGLKPMEYLTYIFEQYQNNKDISKLLPWSDLIPDNCRIKSV